MTRSQTKPHTYTKGGKRRVEHTEYDNRYTQANRINNMNSTCARCGTTVRASQKGKSMTIRCDCHQHTGTFGGIIEYVDVLSAFYDSHP